MRGQNRAGEQEEELARAGFERVGEDAADEGEEKRQRPKPGRAHGLRGDEGREREQDQKRRGVAEVAAAAHSAIEHSGNAGRDQDGEVRQAAGEAAIYNKTANAREREPETCRSAGEDVAEGGRAKSVEREEDCKRADGGDEENLKDVAATTFGEVKHEGQRCDEANDCGQKMRRRGEAQRDGQQHDARTPLAARPLHGVGDADGGVDESVESPHGEDVVIGRDRHADDGGAEAVEAEREETALVAVETARNPPQAAAQQQREEHERQMDENDDEVQLMARLPCGSVERAAGVEAIGGRTKVIDSEQSKALEGERKASHAVGECSVAVEVAAGGEGPGERRGTLPHLAAAAGEAIVGGGELLVADDPETLGE